MVIYLVNLFTNAECILLSKINQDYRNGNKDELVENFSYKNLDTMKETENQNNNSKSIILAPFNSSLNEYERNILNSRKPQDLSLSYVVDVPVQNDMLKYEGKVKELNRQYELNNNEEIDNGILVNNPNQENQAEQNPVSPPNNVFSAPMSPPDIQSERISELVSPREEVLSHRNRKSNNSKELNCGNTFVLDENILKMVENIGYKKEFILKSLNNSDMNYATSAYYLFMSVKLDESAQEGKANEE